MRLLLALELLYALPWLFPIYYYKFHEIFPPMMNSIVSRKFSPYAFEFSSFCSSCWCWWFLTLTFLLDHTLPSMVPVFRPYFLPNFSTFIVIVVIIIIRIIRYLLIYYHLPRDSMCTQVLFFFCFFLGFRVCLCWDFGRNLCMNISLSLFLFHFLSLCVCVCNAFCLPMDYIIFLYRIHFYSCVSFFFIHSARSLSLSPSLTCTLDFSMWTNKLYALLRLVNGKAQLSYFNGILYA